MLLGYSASPASLVESLADVQPPNCPPDYKSPHARRRRRGDEKLSGRQHRSDRDLAAVLDRGRIRRPAIVVELSGLSRRHAAGVERMRAGAATQRQALHQRAASADPEE